MDEETIPDNLAKLYLVHDNLKSIRRLSDYFFNEIRNFENGTNKRKCEEVDNLNHHLTTAMLFQLSVGHLYNLHEILRFFENDKNYKKELSSNRFYKGFEDNRELIKILRNNIILHGKLSNKPFIGINNIPVTNLSKNEILRKVWFTVEGSVRLCDNIQTKFKRDYSSKTKTILENTMRDNDENYTELYFKTIDEFYHS